MQYPDFITRRPGERRPYETDGAALADVKRLVSMGEGSRLEFKRRVPEGSRVAKEVTALANTHGGQLMIGVTDEGDVVGLRDAEEEEFSLQHALEAYCEPPVAHTVRRISVSRRRDVIVVDVPESRSKPHFVVNGDTGKARIAYVRVQDMSVEASREAVRLMRVAGREENVQFEFGKKELKLMRYLDEYGRISVEQYARIAAVGRRVASHTLVLLTRGGLLVHHLDATGDYFTLAANGST